MGLLRRGMAAGFRGKWKIMRGDRVQITAGKDKGQVGTVMKVIRDPDYPRVIVEGLNLNKRHIKRTKDNPGGVVSVEAPLHYSNVRLLDPMSNLPVRVTWRYTETGAKVRVTTGRGSSESIIERPDVLKQRRKPRNADVGPLDTPSKEAAGVTHTPGDLPSVLKEHLAKLAQAEVAPAGSTAAAVGAAAAQQQRHYSTAAAALAAVGCGGGSTRGGLLGPRLVGGSLWRGFAAGGLR